MNVALLPTCTIGRTTNEAGRIVVWVVGELDVRTAPDLRAVLEDLAERRRSTLLDLSATTFMDRAGLAIVLRATATAEREGWPFMIADGAPLAVIELFHLAGARLAAPLRRRDR